MKVINIRISNKVKTFFSNNEFFEVFTPAYHKRAELKEYMASKKDAFKLNAAIFDVDACIQRLKDHSFESNFEISSDQLVNRLDYNKTTNYKK